MLRGSKVFRITGTGSARRHWTVPPLFTNVKVSCLRGIAASLKDHRGAAAPPSLIEKPVPPDLNTSPLHLRVPPV